MNTRTNQRVLVVEDSPTAATHYRIVLEDAGYIVEVVGSLSEAAIRLNNTTMAHIDVFVLDMVLPNGKGIEVVEKMVKNYPGIPIVATTAYDINMVDVIQAGAQSLLRKGEFEERELVRAVKEAIPRHMVRGKLAPIERTLAKLREHITETKDQLLVSLPGDSQTATVAADPKTESDNH